MINANGLLVKLKKTLDILANHVVFVRSNLAIIEGIKELVEEDNDYTMVMNQSVAFWNMTFHNCWEEIAHSLSKVFDDGQDVISVPSVIDMCEKNRYILEPALIEINEKSDDSEERFPNYDAMLQELHRLYGNPTALRKKLKAIRNKQVAHSDRQIAFGNRAALMLKRTDAEQLSDIAESVINIIAGSLFDTVYCFHVLDDEKDVKTLLSFAMAGYKQTKVQREKKRKEKATQKV